MSNDIAIKVHDLHKSFDRAENKSTSIKQLFVNFGKKNKKKRQKVLDGIDFEIKKGEFFGIVGKNGSGKSTLLKLLAGVYTPDSGAVEINGNLTPFIELGVGFNPELSGKDNVYLSASLLGYTRAQVNTMYDDIVAFAELEEHMEKKLKNYSSGMQVRLAFSIAVKAKNDILIFDEVLAVGDEAFQQKCLRIFEEYKENAQTVVLVTHDMNSVRNLCTRAMLIDDGKIKHIGTVDSVADLYSDLNIKTDVNLVQAEKSDKTDKKTKSTHTMQVKSRNNKKVYKPSEELMLEISLQKLVPKDAFLGVAIFDSKGEYVFGSNSKGLSLVGTKFNHLIYLDLGPGNYTINTGILGKGGKVIELFEDIFSFRIIDDGNANVGGVARLKYEYESIESNTKGDVVK